MSDVIINPGAGPCLGKPGEITRRNADRNMRRLCRAAGIAPRFRRYGAIDGGLYPYLVTLGKRTALVLMPGCPESWFSASPFPRRLYIEGSSWMWKYAPKLLRMELGLEES